MQGNRPASPAGLSRQRSHQRLVVVVLGLSTGQFLGTLSTTLIATALPTISGDLGGQAHLAWIASTTLLAATVAGPILGKLADALGRRGVFLAIVGLYLAGATVAGTSATTTRLIIGLGIQGIGIGGLQVMTQVLLADVTTPRERGRYIGYVATGYGLAAVSGPFIGGHLVGIDWLGWRWCFLGAVPFAIVVCLLVWPTLPRGRSRTAAGKRLDILGMVMVACAAASLLTLVTFAGRALPWISPATLGLLAALFGSIALLVAAERRATDPVLPGRMLRTRPIQWCVLTSMLTSGVLYVLLFLIPQYLQVARGVSPSSSGTMLLPFLATQVLSTLLLGTLIARRGSWKPYLVGGSATVSAGVAILALTRGNSADAGLVVGMVLVGIGLGGTAQVLMAVAQSQASPHDLGVTTSLITFARSFGAALGVTLIGAIISARVHALLPTVLSANGLPSDTSVPLGSPKEISVLPAAVREAVSDAYATAFHDALLIILPLVLLAPIMAGRVRAPALADVRHHERPDRHHAASPSERQNLEQRP